MSNHRLCAGAAAVDVTPPLGVPLIGMERHEMTRELRDPLIAGAVALSIDGVAAVVIGVDLLAVHHATVATVRSRITELAPGAVVVISASHTHSGPPVFAYHNSPPNVRAYVASLPERLVAAARQALETMRPARLAVGRASAPIGINRRPSSGSHGAIEGNPDRPSDPEVLVWAIDDLDGRPIATVANLACHPVVLGNDANAISADWPGAMRSSVEGVTEAPCIFLQGAAGDINPLPGVPTNDPADLVRHGTVAADGVLTARDRAALVDVDGIRESRSVVRLGFGPPRRGPGVAPLVELGDYLGHLDRDGIQHLFRTWMPWEPPVADQVGGPIGSVEVQAVGIGPARLVAFAVEPFVETGLRIKASQPDGCLVVGYANGMLGYAPRTADYIAGGYEVDEAHLFYGTPGPLAIGSTECLEDTAIELLRGIV